MVKMTDRLFWAVKTMINGGATINETAEFFKLGLSTVGRVKASENMREYHNILAAMYAKKKTKPQDKPEAPATTKPDVNPPAPQVVEQRVTVQATRYMESEMHKMTEALELISRKLTATLEAVEALLECWKSN